MSPQIAILVLDTPIAGVAEEFGDFGDNIKELLRDSPIPVVKYQVAVHVDENGHAEAGEVALMTKTFHVLEKLIEAGSIKAVVLSGSRSDSFVVGNPWIDALDEFIQNSLFSRENFPIVGLCFGHQVLAKNLGARVYRNTPENGWEVGITTISLNNSVFEIENSPFKKALTVELGKLLEHVNLVEFHRDVVYGLPPSLSANPLLSNTTFQSIGSTAKCSIQGLITESGPLKVLSFQGHPEFTTEEALRILEIDLQKNLIDNTLFERATYNTKNLINQGMLIAQVILEFVASF